MQWAGKTAGSRSFGVRAGPTAAGSRRRAAPRRRRRRPSRARGGGGDAGRAAAAVAAAVDRVQRGGQVLGLGVLGVIDEHAAAAVDVDVELADQAADRLHLVLLGMDDDRVRAPLRDDQRRALGRGSAFARRPLPAEPAAGMEGRLRSCVGARAAAGSRRRRRGQCESTKVSRRSGWRSQP